MGTFSRESRRNSSSSKDSQDGTQRARTPAAKSNLPDSVHSVLSQAGHPLDAGVRAAYQTSFGHDFSGVRVHSDSLAARSAADVGARAYTVGNHIVFGQGEPASKDRDQLLAHELAHTIQQKPAPTGAALAVTDTLDSREQSAANAASRVLAGQRGVGARLSSGPPALMRQAIGTNAPATQFPTSAGLQATAYAYPANENWGISGPLHSQAPFTTQNVAGTAAFIPPVQLHVDYGARWIIEIVVSLNGGTAAQAYYWRCNATAQPATIDPLGAVPLAAGGQRDPVLTIGGNQGTSPTTYVQASVGVTSPTSSVTHTPFTIQPQVGGGFTSGSGTSGNPTGGATGALTFVPPTDQTQRSPATPSIGVTFTADVTIDNAPHAATPQAAPVVADKTYEVQFANDSSALTSAEVTRLLQWVHSDLGGVPHLRDAIRSGQVQVHIVGRASTRGNAAHNFTLSQRRVDAVRVALEGEASKTGGGRTQGGVLGGESLRIDAEADGDFHDPQPRDQDQDRVVQIFIAGAEAASAIQRITSPSDRQP